MAAGWAAGTVVMVLGYFLAEVGLYGLGPALVEAPGNLLQNVAGGLIGVPLYWAVRRAYPPITTWTTPLTWREK